MKAPGRDKSTNLPHVCLDSQTQAHQLIRGVLCCCSAKFRCPRLNILQVLGKLQHLCWILAHWRCFVYMDGGWYSFRCCSGKFHPPAAAIWGPCFCLQNFFTPYSCIYYMSPCFWELEVMPRFGSSLFSCPFQRELVPFSFPHCCCIYNSFITTLLSASFR